MKQKNKIFRILSITVISTLVFIITFVFLFFSFSTVDIPIQERELATRGSYPIVSTGQYSYWNSLGNEINTPLIGEPFFGQDPQFPGTTASYIDNQDGTVSDLVTSLMWTQSPDLNSDGTIDFADQMTLKDAIASVDEVDIGGYDDWRLPTLKELYSLINFSGIDPKLDDTDSSRLTPFIDTRYFDFGYGDIEAGDRIIDAQFATSTLYVDDTYFFMQTMFGVNFADGRIKGYPLAVSATGIAAKTFYVFYVRGNLAYGVNDFHNNEDGTISDEATLLMWSQGDSDYGMDWESALAWVQTKNSENYLGYHDWRLPNIKELQSIVDYTRAPGETNSAAIDPMFFSTKITNEAGNEDYGFYWSSTTHMGSSQRPGEQAAYMSFGRGMGKMFGIWMDVHGAGAQRSDPKSGNANDFSDGFGPQGDAIRINNFVRLVRTNDDLLNINPPLNSDNSPELNQNIQIMAQNSLAYFFIKTENEF
jgi:hypothetical protein